MTVDKKYIINRQGKDFILYEGLLDAAHAQGLKRIATTLLQVPTNENGNIAICHAEVETERGSFSGIGDASPGNVNKMILPHLIRMAETRAKARSLRDATNIGVTAFEELGDNDDSAAKAQPAPRHLHPVATPGDLRQQVNEAINALADATNQPLTELVPIVMADAGIKGKNGKTMTNEERQRVLDVIHTRLDSLALSNDAPVAETVPAEEERF